MAYKESGGMTDKLCLTGETAKDYFRTSIGETVKLTITAVLKSAGMMAPDDSNSEEMPCVEFEVLEVDGGRKPYSEMSSGEMESQIHNVKNEDQPEPRQQAPNIEDGGSIWNDVKRQAKIGQTPQRRPKPFRIG